MLMVCCDIANFFSSPIGHYYLSLSLIIFDPSFRCIVDLFTIFLMVIGQPVSPKSSESPKDLEFEFLSSLEQMQGRKTADFMPLLRHCRWELSVLSVFIEQYASEPQTLHSNSTSVFSNRTTRLFLFCSKVFCSLWAGMNVEDRNGLIYIYIQTLFSPAPKFQMRMDLLSNGRAV
jgi:hypothetical protein